MRAFNVQIDRPVAVSLHDGSAWVTLIDGRVISTPLTLHPWLAAATPEQLANVEFDPVSVWWPDLDDGLDVEWMLRESGIVGE